MAAGKEHKKYFIKQYSFTEYMHGGIGYTDAETILEREGFQPIVFPCHDQFSIQAKWKRLIYLFRIFLAIKGPATIVFIFPVYAGMVKWLLKLLKSKKDVRLICFIGDIDGIKDGDKERLQADIAELQRYKHFIVHNEAMQQWLQQQIPGAHISPIHFFDFLAKPYHGNRILSCDIAFAGNLAKSTFLEQIGNLAKPGSHLYFTLYGPGCTEKMQQQKNATWMGIEKPYDLPVKLKGSFGLLWDGDSIGEPGGSLGDYMRYISHHKLSLYILSGLPLIVPEIAGSASLVARYKIGIAVKSLYEIEDKIKNITEDEYQQMRKNMQRFAEQISEGGCIKEALQKLVSW